MGSAPTSLRVHEEFRRYFRTWDIMDVTVARMKYRQLTLRYCINMEQLAIVLGRQLPDPLVSFVFGLFAPKPIREPRSVPVVDAVEVFVGLILVCQATLAQRIAFIFDMMDSRGLGQLSESELSILLCAVARSVVKMTSPPYAVHPESMHKFALAGIAQEAQRVKSLDKITFCNWATKNPTFVSYIHICTGQDLPRLYIGLEKTNQLIGFIEFDSLTHMQSISAAGLRQLAQFYLPSDFEFLQQGRKVDKHNEPNVKAWNLIPFALLGTPGMSFHFKTVDYQKKAILTGITIDSGPHPNQRPHGSFQFQYHHHVVESYARSVHHIAPIHKHYHFRLKGDTVWWLPSQFWCGDWLLNQSRIASHSRHRLKSKLRKLNKVFSGTIVKDASGHILSHSSTLQAQQSKLRLLALNTQLEADDIKSEDKSVIIIDLENKRKQYHKRMLGTIKRKTAPIDTNWKVIDSRAVQPNAWSKSNSSIPLRADEIQAFPVVWIRPLENEESPMDEVDISRKDESVVFLIRTIIQSLGDKRIMNGQDVFGRTLLHHAAVYGQSRIVDVLLSEHALINIGDSQGNTPLHVAASRGRLKEVSALVAKGAVTTALNVHHQLPLLLALYHAARKRGTFKSNDVMTKYSTIEQVIDLLWDRTPPAWWHVPDIYNVTIFQMEQAIFGDIFEAARAGLVPRIQHLVESKKVSDINATMPELRRTALHEACERGRYNTCDYLVRSGADVFAQDIRGSTPLHVAAPRGFDKIVELLVHRYPKATLVQDINENSFVVFGNHYVLKDDTALMGSPLTLSLHLASRVFQLPTVDIAPAEPELLAKNQHIYLSKQELIHREKWQSWYRVASILCNKLLEIDSSFKIHVYPTDISLACSLGFWSIADQLLTQRRIPFPRICDDVDKMEAIHYAAGAGQTAIVAALVTNGVNPNVKVKHITHRFSKQHNRCTFFSVGPLYMSFSRGHLVTAAKLLLLGATVDSLPQIRAMILLNGGWNTWMKLNYLQQHKRSQQFTQHANMVRQLESATRTNLSIVHVACLRGTLELLKIYCLAGHSLHDVTPDGHTPLTLAIQAEHTDIVEWICDKHPQVLLVKAMHLPLVIACGLNPQSKKKHKIYNSLLSRGISISDVGADGLSALDKAAYVADNAIFELLVEAKAKPRVSTIIAALQGRNESIIQQLVSIVSSIDGATFDHLLQIFILASSQRQWLLLEHILTLLEAFIDPISTWIRRAASCCLFLHRAAAANQTKIVRLLLAKGVPADLVVAEIPHTRSPIWYATIYGALDSFLALVLHLSPQHLILSALNCEVPWKLNCLQLPLHSIDTTDVVRVTGFETCTWRNISTMSCYQSARTRSLRFIHRCIQYWIAHSLVQPRNEDNQTLLHLAAKAGDEQTLRVIVEAGGKLETFNNHMQSPAMLTAQRGDASGTKMLQYIWPLLSDDHKVLVCQACTQSPQINLSSLRFCLQESKFFKGMHYAPSILSGQAAAIELLIAAKIPIEYTVWQNLSIVLQSKQAKRCGQIVQSLLPVLDTSVETEIVADIAAAAAKFQWWPILSHLLQLFGACLVKSLCHIKEGYSRSILHEAVVAGEHQIIQYLLQQGGDIQSDSKGQSPLHYIAWIGDLSLFHLFKRYLPSDRFLQVLNHQDSLGRTACHIAAMRGHLDLFDSLLSTGANNDIRTKEGNTPVLVAAKHNQQHIVMRLVLQKPPASSLETLHQESIVIVAAKYGAFRIVSWLLLTLNLPSSTVIGLVCKEGKTITHYAALHNELSTLTTHSYLLQTINAKDSYGCTPLHYALMHGQLEVIQYLCWNGANVFGPIQNLIPNNEMFDVSMLFEWSPLPGWFAHLMRANANSKIQKNRNTDFRRGLRCWSFPKTSLLEFATATGCLHTVSYIMSVLRYLPQLCQGTPDVRQRIFMTAVTQNRVDVVDVMLASDVKQVVEDSGDISQTQVQYFGDFVLTALNHSSRRGLEAMTLCLLRHEKEVVPNEAITPGIPNNQSQSDSICHSAKLLQYACIYGHLDLIRELVRRSGSAILNFHSDDGPAIIYAIAFGHIDAVRVLMQAGAEISSLNSIHVPSMKRWHEFRQPATPQPSWPFYQPQKAKRRRRSFRGPIEKYEVVERLPREMLAHITSSSQFTA
ncbi:hypothetical protein LEN26_015940 [Aphanomyces euteiches]|nr:hypothetical protein LEN26_015940 [Aphanomyces euteiches]